MAKKIPKQVKSIQEFKAPTIDYSFQRSISYSQTLSYNTCPHQWALSYGKKLLEYRPSIHTVFGTALHEVIQEWLNVMYNRTIKQASEMNLESLFETTLFRVYKEEKEKYQKHFSSAEELQSFWMDGVEILRYLQKKRAMYFSTQKMYLVGVEVPLVYPLTDKLFFKGFVDVIFYDEAAERYLVLDIKTSTSGWNELAKKDEKKTAQLLLYKEFIAKQFNIDVDKIDVQYFIVKRKVPANPDFASMARRVQEFTPPSGKIKRGQVLSLLNKFISDCFDQDGKFIDKEYEKKSSTSNCRFCEYKNTSLCSEGV